MSYNLLIMHYLYKQCGNAGKMRPVFGQHGDPSPVIAHGLSLSASYAILVYHGSSPSWYGRNICSSKGSIPFREITSFPWQLELHTFFTNFIF